MTLKQYAKEIQKLAKKHPDALVVYSIDDEGNAYHSVNMGPSMGHFDAHENEFETGLGLSKEINAVCLN